MRRFTIALGLSLLLYTIMGPHGSAHAGLIWQQATAAAPWSQRFNHTCTAFNGRLWVTGGWCCPLSDVWSTTDGVNWSLATGSPWPARYQHTMAVFNGAMWMTGGQAGGFLNDVWFSPNGSSWTAAPVAPWMLRCFHNSLSFDGRLWIMDGYDGTGSPLRNDVWYSTNGANWALATSSPGWSRRTTCAGLVHDGRMWLTGGYEINGSTQTNDVWSSTDGANWVKNGGAPWLPRERHSVVSHAGYIWVMGGAYTGGSRSDVWYSTDGASWTIDTSAAPWGNRSQHASDVFDDKVWLLGGGNGVQGNDVWFATFCSPPSITTPPASQLGCDGGMVSLGVTPGGPGPFSYQWRKGGSNLGGATSNPLVIDPVSLGDAGIYDVIVTNPCGQITSATASLTVNAAPAISGHPAGQMVTNCTPVVLTLTATGGDLSYQWRRDGSALMDGGHLSGTSTASLTVHPFAAGDSGDYDVIVSNSCGTATSNAATVTLDFGIRPDCNSNDIPDDCDIDSGLTTDCNTNGAPDECDLADGGSADCDTDGTPDECQPGSGTYAWIGPDAGLFDEPSHWSASSRPGSRSEVVLSNAAMTDNRCLLTGPDTTTICSLSVSATGSGRQILQIDEAATLHLAGGGMIHTGGTLRMAGGRMTGGPVINQSNTIEGHGSILTDVENHGLIRGEPAEALRLLGNQTLNESDGVIAATPGMIVLVNSPTVSQLGELRAHALAGIFLAGPLHNQSGGLITLYGGVLDANGFTNDSGADLTGFGTIDTSVVNSGMMTIIADMQIIGDLTNDGTIIVQSGLLTITGSLGGSGAIIGGFGG